MKIEIIQSTNSEQQYLISYLINDTVAVDAGCIGLMSPVERQDGVKHIFLSHSHIDHTASLPIFLDNVFTPGPACPTVYAIPETIESIKNDMFNNRLWPDFIGMSNDKIRFVDVVPLALEQPLTVDRLKVTAVALKHVVPTVGYIISDSTTAIAIISDTLPSNRVWEVLETTPNLKAVFLEVSFPNNMAWLAEAAAHLTPATFANEVAKIRVPVDIIAVHLKARYRDPLKSELAALNLPRLQIGVSGALYEF